MRGVYTAIVTPFTKDGAIDFTAFEKLIHEQSVAGVAGLVIGGTTGEAATLSAAERKELYQFAMTHKASLDLVAGTGTNCTAESVELTKMALSLGYEKVLVVTPYYNKPTPAGLEKHYREIAATGAKMIVYNVPGRTGLNLSPAAFKRLTAIKNVIAFKEATGSIAQLIDYLELVGTDRIDYLSGDDFTMVPFVFTGGVGVISVLSNLIPAATVEMMQLALDGKVAEASAMQIRYNALCRALFMESSPLPVKTALALRGKITESFRAPLEVMESQNREKLAAILQNYHLL